MQRRSKAIQLVLLGGGLAAFSACMCGGCGQRPQPQSVTTIKTYDPDWFDAQGNAIPRAFKDDNGKRVPEQPVFDKAGQPITFDDQGNAIPPAGWVAANTTTTTTTTSSYRSGWSPSWWWFGRPSYSGGYGYRSGPTNTGGTYFGGSRPGSSSGPSVSSGGTVSRGGFGSTGARVSGVS